MQNLMFPLKWWWRGGYQIGDRIEFLQSVRLRSWNDEFETQPEKETVDVLVNSLGTIVAIYEPKTIFQRYRILLDNGEYVGLHDDKMHMIVWRGHQNRKRKEE